jgi:hypothetical protein
MRTTFMGIKYSSLQLIRIRLPKPLFLGERINLLKPFRRLNGQASLEIALIAPILLIMVLGVVELSFIMGRYMDMLDLTREAARFASARDPFAPPPETFSCDAAHYDFYYSTACFIMESSYLTFNSETDDVVISVYSVSDHSVSATYPESGPWELTGNWNKDCEGNVVLTEPHYTSTLVDGLLSNSAPAKEGFVAVEYYYCYNLVLDMPIVSSLIHSPLRLHAFTLMPLPKAQPSGT